MSQALRKVLVIEDDPSAARFVGYTLEQEGYRVLTASNGVEGLNSAREEGPDLVILDILLPGVDGFEVCHRLKSDPNTRAIPVLILSAKARESDRKTGLKVGAEDYLVKPADPSDLVKRVEKLLADRRAKIGRAIAFLDCTRGVAASMVVTNAAVVVAQQGQQVVLVDLSPGPSPTLSLLGLTEEQSVYKLFGISSGAADQQGVLTLCATHHSGVKVLYNLHMAKGEEEITAVNVERVLQEVRMTADYVLVELSSRRSETQQGTLRQCDLVVLVTDSGDGLSRAKARAGHLSGAGLDRGRLALVVIDREDTLSGIEFCKMGPIVESVVQLPLLGLVPCDLKVPLECEVRGLPVVLAEPTRPVSLALREVAERLIELLCGGGIGDG